MFLETFAETRFTVSFQVYKLKKVWPLFDVIGQNWYIIVGLIVFVLALHWQISVAMFINLTCFAS